MIERRLAFEVQHGVHDVLEGLRPSDATALRDVPDEHDRGTGLFGKPHETRGTFADLADIPGRALQLFGIRGLDGIEQDDARLELRGMMENGFEPRLTEDVDAAGVFL